MSKYLTLLSGFGSENPKDKMFYTYFSKQATDMYLMSF